MFVFLLAATAYAAPEYHAEASAQILPSEVAADLRARVDGEHDGYIGGAMRVSPGGAWLGHAGVGLDVLGGGDAVDLKLGLFLGGTGDVSELAMYGRPAAGFEGLFGLRIGRVYGSYRHLDGFAGPLEDRLTEDELRVGFALTDHLRLHGQYLLTNPGTHTYEGGAGIGVEAVW